MANFCKATRTASEQVLFFILYLKYLYPTSFFRRLTFCDLSLQITKCTMGAGPRRIIEALIDLKNISQ